MRLRTVFLISLFVLMVCGVIIFFKTRSSDVEKICDGEHRIDSSAYADISVDNVGRLQLIRDYIGSSEYSVRINFSPDNHLLAISGFEGIRLGSSDTLDSTEEVHLWNLPESCFTRFGSIAYNEDFVAFDSTGKFMITNDNFRCGCYMLYAIPEGREIARYKYDQLPERTLPWIANSTSDLWRLWASNPGEQFVTFSRKNSLQFRSLDTRTILSEIPLAHPITSLSYSPDGKFIAVGLQELHRGYVEILAVPSLQH